MASIRGYWDQKKAKVAGVTFGIVFLLASFGFAGPARGDDERGASGNDCPTSLSTEPTCNRYLAQGPWAGSHRSSYAQGSSPLAAPRSAAGLDSDRTSVPGVPTTYGFSGEYDDGGRILWMSPVGTTNTVVKLDAKSLETLDSYVPRLREDNPPAVSPGISGAYNLVDVDNRFIVARGRSVEVYGDAEDGVRTSGISLITRFNLPASAFCGTSDSVVGMAMTYDGHLALVSERGVVSTVPRKPVDMLIQNVTSHSINPEDCASQQISNSLSIDESGGLYIVASDAMYRIDWDGNGLVQRWRSAYESGVAQPGIRLGSGSGSTPSLMGTQANDDRFVVLTDGQPLMHLVLMWRDEIPDGWEPIGPGKDPRIACEIPIRFGDPDATESLSEQSVLVRGSSAVVVNNRLTGAKVAPFLPAIAQNLSSVLQGGLPNVAPYGIERVDWNPATRTCESVWANPEISIPNAIPTMSETTGLIYAHGQQNGVWGLEAVDFVTGERRFFAPAPDPTCRESTVSLRSMDKLVATYAFFKYPGSCQNSAYAAATVGPDGALYQGTLFGMTRYGSN